MRKHNTIADNHGKTTESRTKTTKPANMIPAAISMMRPTRQSVRPPRGLVAHVRLWLREVGHPRQLAEGLLWLVYSSEAAYSSEVYTTELPRVPSSSEGKHWTKPISGLSSIQSVKRRGFWSVVVQHRLGGRPEGFCHVRRKGFVSPQGFRGSWESSQSTRSPAPAHDAFCRPSLVYLCRMHSALRIASSMHISRAGQGLSPMSATLRAARMVQKTGWRASVLRSWELP